MIVSTHGPTAHGRTDQLCELMADLATMEPLGLPRQAELEQMLAAMGPPPPAQAGDGPPEVAVAPPV